LPSLRSSCCLLLVVCLYLDCVCLFCFISAQFLFLVVVNNVVVFVVLISALHVFPPLFLELVVSELNEIVV
jgi:hypothetical protein